MPEPFDLIAELIYQASGIRLDKRKHVLLKTRLRHRLSHFGLSHDVEGLQAYLSIVQKGDVDKDDELGELVDAITTQETSFCRTPHAFEWLTQTFVPTRINELRLATDSIRIWSAASSTGAELYSMAACLLADTPPAVHGRLKLWGSDISPTAVQIAKSGEYTGRIVQRMDEATHRLIFGTRSPVDGNYRVREPLRRCTEFFVHNLLDPPPRKDLDVIFVQNVLIYFDDQSKMIALNRMHDALRPGGYLVVGPSEGIYGLPHHFERVKTFLYRRPQKHTPNDDGSVSS